MAFLEPFQMLLSQDLRILTEVLQVTDRGIEQLSCQDQVSAHWFKTTNPGIKMDGKPSQVVDDQQNVDPICFPLIG